MTADQSRQGIPYPPTPIVLPSYPTLLPSQPLPSSCTIILPLSPTPVPLRLSSYPYHPTPIILPLFSYPTPTLSSYPCPPHHPYPHTPILLPLSSRPYPRTLSSYAFAPTQCPILNQCIVLRPCSYAYDPIPMLLPLTSYAVSSHTYAPTSMLLRLCTVQTYAPTRALRHVQY
eukprot:2026652-Rhodomonas_salina.2